MSALLRLQRWYARQCDGDWEHRAGVTIQSCDNPGWWIKVDLQGTSLETIAFERVAENVDADGFQQDRHWLDCRISGAVWHGAGDETQLKRILELFLSWAEGHGS
jgi:hypothetical protein